MGHSPRVSDDELRALLDAVNKTGGNQCEAAKLLGINRNTLVARLREAKTRGLKAKIADPQSPEALKHQVRKLEAELRIATRAGAEAAAVAQAIGGIAEGVNELDLPEWMGNPIEGASAPGTPTLFLSDLHWGEVVRPSQIGGVNEFNIRIAHERMQYTVETAIHLLNILGGPYPGIVVPLGGDMISGNIHDELTATNEINSMPAVLDLYGQLVAAITRLAEVFGHVFLPCVTGNHGRDTRKIWAKDRHHTSFDWLLYQFLAKRFEGDARVTFFIPDSSDAAYRIYHYRYLLTHGDQFRGGDSIIGPIGPLTRGDQKKRARNQAVDQEYDVMICGHWHQYMHMRRLIVNGSMKGYDEYAYAGNFGFEPPTQALWVTHPRHEITYRMPVYCEAQKRRAETAWVSWPKKA
jgi:transposase-like protein